MAKALATLPATYHDVQAAPPDQIAELVAGLLHLSPRPAIRHARTSSRLGARLTRGFDFGEDGPGGWWILDEPEVHLGSDVVVPDLAGWRQDHLPELPDEAWISQPPDWACEILSPSTIRFDRVEKVPLYAREGVGHVWLIDPRSQTLEVLRLERGRYVILGSFAGATEVRAEPFDGMALLLGELWG